MLRTNSVSLVTKAGHADPRFANRLDARKRKRFWEIVKAWQSLLGEDLSKSGTK